MEPKIFDLELAKKIKADKNISNKIFNMWVCRKKIPDQYIKAPKERIIKIKGAKWISNAETRKLQEILNYSEIRSGRIPTTLSSGSVSMFKMEISNKMEKEAFLAFKIFFNNLSLEIKKFAKKDLEVKEKYLLQVMDIASKPFLNWQAIYDKVNVNEKPNYAVLLHSYFNSERRGINKPHERLIKRFPAFFEQLRFELMLLSEKLKI